MRVELFANREVIEEAIKIAENIGCYSVADVLESSLERNSRMIPRDKDLDVEFRVLKDPKELTNGKA